MQSQQHFCCKAAVVSTFQQVVPVDTSIRQLCAHKHLCGYEPAPTVATVTDAAAVNAQGTPNWLTIVMN